MKNTKKQGGLRWLNIPKFTEAPKVHRLSMPCYSPSLPLQTLFNDHDGIGGRSWLECLVLIRSTVEPVALGAERGLWCSPSLQKSLIRSLLYFFFPFLSSSLLVSLNKVRKECVW